LKLLKILSKKAMSSRTIYFWQKLKLKVKNNFGAAPKLMIEDVHNEVKYNIKLL
jgi:hypothetical protein